MARGHFAKSEAQAASVIKEVQGKGNAIESVGTARNYEQALKTCCDYLKEHKLGGLRDLTPEIAKSYLADWRWSTGEKVTYQALLREAQRYQ